LNLGLPKDCHQEKVHGTLSYLLYIIIFCLSDSPLIHFHPFVAFDIQTPQNLWIEAINITNYLTNCFLTRANFGVTPYQQLKCKKLHNLNKFHIFGNATYVHVPIKEK